MARGIYIGVNGVARKIKNGYIGIPSVKVTNMLPAINGNTNFTSGTSSTIHTKYAASSLMLTGTTDKAEVVTQTVQSYPLDPTHIYYARAEVYQERAVGGTSVYWPIAEPNFYSGKKAIAGQWTIVSKVNKRDSFATGSYPFRLDFDNEKNAENMWFDGVMLIDLTADFGVGNEPTAEWCDVNIPYFVGSKYIDNASFSSVARRIKRAYIGIGGVARICFGIMPIEYYGKITELSKIRVAPAATSIGNYALFGGNGGDNDIIDVYNTSLVKSEPIARTSFAFGHAAATTIGNYAMFTSPLFTAINGETRVIDAYDASLTLTSVTVSYPANEGFAATSVGNYALFAGGRYYDNAYIPVTTVSACDTSLTVTTPTELSQARYNLASTTIGNYALFGGGAQNLVNYSSVVDAYDTSLTRVIQESLSQSRGNLAATTVGDYALFGGGNSNLSTTYIYNIVDVYNTSLTKITSIALSQARYDLAATTIGNYALFGGGYYNDTYATVDVYNTALTRIMTTALSESRLDLAATSVGNYALFAGGRDNSGNGFNTVDAYVYNNE